MFVGVRRTSNHVVLFASSEGKSAVIRKCNSCGVQEKGVPAYFHFKVA